MTYRKPEIRTLDAKSVLESFGPASAMASGQTDPVSWSLTPQLAGLPDTYSPSR